MEISLKHTQPKKKIFKTRNWDKCDRQGRHIKIFTHYDFKYSFNAYFKLFWPQESTLSLVKKNCGQGALGG